MIRLVINADDYGIAENQTEAILMSFKKGIITSTTVMVTMPDFERAAQRAEEEGVFDRIGLHLNFTQGKPLTDQIRACPNFCGSDGCFNKVFHNSKWKRLHLTSTEKRAVGMEAEAQMKRYVDRGFPLMHFDSHHHSHTDLSLAAIILPIARRLGFRTVRLSRNLPRPGYGFVKKLYKGLFNRQVRNSRFVATTYFGSVSDFDGTVQRLPSDCTVELMVHPSFQKDGHLDLSGILMDMHDPMSKVESILERHRTRFVLVPYSEIR